MTAAVATERRHEIITSALQQLEEGQSLREIAAKAGISHVALRIWLLDDVPDAYKPAQRRALIARIAEADQSLEDSHDHVSISRAREVAKFTRWDAERRLPNLFAPRHEISGPGGGAIQIEDREIARRYAFIKAMAGSVIEAELVTSST